MSFPLTFIIHRIAYPMARANCTQPTISLAIVDRFACSPAGLRVLSILNCDNKAMETHGTFWRDKWKVFRLPSAHRPF